MKITFDSPRQLDHVGRALQAIPDFARALAWCQASPWAEGGTRSLGEVVDCLLSDHEEGGFRPWAISRGLAGRYLYLLGAVTKPEREGKVPIAPVVGEWHVGQEVVPTAGGTTLISLPTESGIITR